MAHGLAGSYSYYSPYLLSLRGKKKTSPSPFGLRIHSCIGCLEYHNSPPFSPHRLSPGLRGGKLLAPPRVLPRPERSLRAAAMMGRPVRERRASVVECGILAINRGRGGGAGIDR